MSRAALKTKNNIDHKFGIKERELAIEAAEFQGDTKLFGWMLP
jgi:hypothetical protein